jgi:hypothetical protein
MKYEKDVEFWNIKTGATYSNRFALNVYIKIK